MGQTALYNAINALFPVRFYKLDEASGSSTATDSGSSPADLTHNNTPTVGVNGPIAGMKAVTYAAADQNSNSATALTMAVQQSFLVIAKSTLATNPAAAEHICSGRVDVNNYWAVLHLTSGYIRFCHNVATDLFGDDIATDSYDGLWHFYGFSADNTGNTLVQYNNGVGSEAASGTLEIACSNGFTVGARTLNISPFAGSVGLVAVFNSYLSVAQWDTLYAAYTATAGGGGNPILIPGLGFGLID